MRLHHPQSYLHRMHFEKHTLVQSCFGTPPSSLWSLYILKCYLYFKKRGGEERREIDIKSWKKYFDANARCKYTTSFFSNILTCLLRRMQHIIRHLVRLCEKGLVFGRENHPKEPAANPLPQ